MKNVSYELIDDTLLSWANRVGGSVRYKVRDDETRIVEFSDDQGKRYRLLLSPPEDEKSNISLWDYDEDIWTTDYNISNLSDRLDIAYQSLNNMISKHNHTRSIYHNL